MTVSVFYRTNKVIGLIVIQLIISHLVLMDTFTFTGLLSISHRIMAICCYSKYLLLIADRKTVSSGLKSSCEAADVIEGHDGRIVCTFEADVSKRLQDIEVHHFSDHILTCYGKNGNITICHTKDGYQYESEISNKLTINMPKVNKDMAGQYSCFVEPSEPEEVQPCNLNVSDFEETVSTSNDHFVYINVTNSTGQEGTVGGEYLYIIPIILGSAIFMSSIFALLLLTRFTHKLDNSLKIRSTAVIYSGSIQNRVEESPREPQETEACL